MAEWRVMWSKPLKAISDQLDLLESESRVYPPPAVAAAGFISDFDLDQVPLEELVAASRDSARLRNAAWALKRAVDDELARRLGDGVLLLDGVVYRRKRAAKWAPIDVEALREYVGEEWFKAGRWEPAVSKLRGLAKSRGDNPEAVVDSFMHRVTTESSGVEALSLERVPDWLAVKLTDGEVWKPGFPEEEHE